MCVRACHMLQQHQYRITGVAVIDVVEGARAEVAGGDNIKGGGPPFGEARDSRLEETAALSGLRHARLMDHCEPVLEREGGKGHESGLGGSRCGRGRDDKMEAYIKRVVDGSW